MLESVRVLTAEHLAASAPPHPAPGEENPGQERLGRPCHFNAAAGDPEVLVPLLQVNGHEGDHKLKEQCRARLHVDVQSGR